MNILQVKSSWIKVTYFLITVVALSLIVIGCSSTAGDEQGDIIEDEKVSESTIAEAATPMPTQVPTSIPTNTPTPILQPMVRGQKDSAIEVTVYNAEKVWPGTTLLSDHHDVGSPRVIEVNMLGEVTWQYVLAEDFKQYTNPGQDVERLANGNTLLVIPGKGIVEVSSEGDVGLVSHG